MEEIGRNLLYPQSRGQTASLFHYIEDSFLSLLAECAQRKAGSGKFRIVCSGGGGNFNGHLPGDISGEDGAFHQHCAYQQQSEDKSPF